MLSVYHMMVNELGAHTKDLLYSHQTASIDGGILPVDHPWKIDDWPDPMNPRCERLIVTPESLNDHDLTVTDNLDTMANEEVEDYETD